MAMNLFDDDDTGLNDFDDFDSDTQDSSDGFGGMSSDNSSDDFSNSDDIINADNTLSENDLDSSGGLKKTAVIMIIIGVIVVIAVFCLARVILHKDNNKTAGNSVQTTQSTNVAVTTNAVQQTQQEVAQTTVNAQEIMGDTTQNNPSSKSGGSYNDSYWTMLNGEDQIEFSEPQAVQFHITAINHYIAKADGSDNYIVKSTLQGSLAGYSGTFHLDIPYEKGIQLQVGQEFTVYITVGSMSGKTVIGEIKY